MTNKKNINKGLIAQISIVVVLALLLVVLLVQSPSGNSQVVGTVSASEIIPQGTPNVYGKEIGVSYDDVSPSNPRLADQTIGKMAKYDQTIDLSGENLERYIKVVSTISCEYCCGAESIIFSNGEPACGCAHSYAMRGVAKYIIQNHGDEFTDKEILDELGKWKVLFFPGIHEQKAKVLESQGVDSTDYVNLASNLYRGIEQQAASGSGGMVGGF